jgi:membrane protease YdiL (CAAX protease family)
LRYLILLIVPTLYFTILWSVPWSNFQVHSSISVSYLFDLLFVALTFFILKKRNILGELTLKGTLIRTGAACLMAIACIAIIKSSGLQSPFKFIEYKGLQLLLFAPLIEELVFRGAFFEIFYKSRLRPQIALLLNSILFSFSHSAGFFYLPVEFHQFIVFQLVYTLFLGWMCSKSRFKSQGILEPIILHFVFNLMFYFGVEHFGI